MAEKTDAPRSVIIIGAGIAGLAAGCYAQMNGFQSQIFELHTLPGGLCTSWRRRGYLFDGSIRLLGGVSPESSTYPLWQELGLMEGRQIHYYDEFVRFEGRDGRAFVLYTDIDRLEQHMLEFSPADEEIIHEFARALRQFTRMELPVDMTPADPLELLQLGQDMLPMLLPTLRWLKVTVSEFAARFQDPLLREALPQFFQFSRPDFPMMLLLSSVAMMNDREMGYPLGGSLRFAQDLAKRYLDLGGQIHYRSRVEEILVRQTGRGARAVGVRLGGKAARYADIVISAADGHSTLFDLLHGLFVNDTIRSTYEQLPVCQSILQVSLGVTTDWSQQPPMVSFPLRRPIVLGNTRHERLVLKHYSFDPTMARPGHSVLTLWCATDYDYWRVLRGAAHGAESSAYREAKEQASAQVIAALEERYPGFAATVEVVDVATPTTYERYTANWHGSFAGWAMTTRKMSMMIGRPMDKTLPGLDGFYMIGQWVEPGGNVELSAASGRDVIKDICRAENLAFRTSQP